MRTLHYDKCDIKIQQTIKTKTDYMEPLSSFGISVAAGIALDIYNESQSTVKKEIEKAFDSALVSWCKNSDIRERKRSEIKKALEKIIAEPELISDLDGIDSELNSFFKKFDEAIAKRHTART